MKHIRDDIAEKLWCATLLLIAAPLVVLLLIQL